MDDPDIDALFSSPKQSECQGRGSFNVNSARESEKPQSTMKLKTKETQSVIRSAFTCMLKYGIVSMKRL